MRFAGLVLILSLLLLSTTSCLELISGDNVKDKISGLTVPISQESEFASSMQSVQVGNNTSTDVFAIIGPLASLGLGSSSGLSAMSLSDNILEWEHDPSGGFYTLDLNNLSTKGLAKVFFLIDASKSNPISYDNIIYLDIRWALDYAKPLQPVYVYNTQDVYSTKLDAKSAETFTNLWLPGPWRRFSSGQPLTAESWLAVSKTDFSQGNTKINDFLRQQIFSYDGLAVIMEARQEDRDISMFYTVERSAAFVPTDEDPARQKGQGTITFSDNSLMNIKDFNLLIGSDGPVSGSIQTERSDGYSTSMNYLESGTITGTIYFNGNFLASFVINPDGTGTYADSSGKIYPIK